METGLWPYWCCWDVGAAETGAAETYGAAETGAIQTLVLFRLCYQLAIETLKTGYQAAEYPGGWQSVSDRPNST